MVQTACRDFPNSVDFWNPTPCWILIDLPPDSVALTSGCLHRYLQDTEGRPEAFKGPFGRLHMNPLFLSWILHGLFMDSFWKLVISYCLWFDHFLNTWRFWIENRPFVKFFNFFYPELSQLKNWQTPPLAILGQKHLTGLEIHFLSKNQKIIPLFVTQWQRVNKVLSQTVTKNKNWRKETRLGRQWEISTHLDLNLWKRSESLSKICKHIGKS